MPLKYIFKFGVFVKFGGWLHGALFVTLACVIVYVWWLRKWPLLRAILAGLATLLPFGTFWFDKKLKSEIKLLSKTN
jgi:integral membrane protein